MSQLIPDGSYDRRHGGAHQAHDERDQDHIFDHAGRDRFSNHATSRRLLNRRVNFPELRANRVKNSIDRRPHYRDHDYDANDPFQEIAAAQLFDHGPPEKKPAIR
jgi:hypothetical protein